eukprot:SAG22_NODE_952_length_6343_cov_3.567265_7_plen_44_part_00
MKNPSSSISQDSSLIPYTDSSQGSQGSQASTRFASSYEDEDTT